MSTEITVARSAIIRVVVFLPVLLAQSAFAGETLQSLDREFKALIDSTKQSVVTVTSVFSHEVSVESESGILSFFKDPVSEKRPYSYTNIGSGVVLDDSGHVMTRSSVVVGADVTFVTFADGQRLEASFVAEDSGSGFAVLKVESINPQPARFSNEHEISAGTPTLIVGNSLGVFPSISFAMLNGVSNDGMLQVSGYLNPGNNGSPVINFRGEIIGLLAGRLKPFSGGNEAFNEAGYGTMTLAYPTNWLKRIADDLVNFGYVRKGWIGVVGYHDGWRPKIREIKANSPAEMAGLVEGDVIVGFASVDVHNIAELARLVEFTTPGETVPLTYMRGSETLETRIEIGEKRRRSYKSDESQSETRNPDLGVTVQQESNDAALLDPQSRDAYIEQRIRKLENEIRLLKEMLNQ